MKRTKEKFEMRPMVMAVTVVLFLALLAAIVINAKGFYHFLNNLVMKNAMWGLGWFVSITCFIMVVLCLVIMFSPIGRIRLGGPNAKPKFTTMQWFGISLCTGIGAGIVFWGAAEPLMFAMEPAPSTGLEPKSNAAVLWSMVRCFTQWGLTPYATCVIMGVILSYLILNKKAPFKTSSLLIPIFGEKVTESKLADLFDSWTAFALTAAVAGGLGYGTMQFSAAIEYYTGIKSNLNMYIIIIAVLFVCYNVTAISGLRKGITALSNNNVKLFFLLLLFVFLAGPTTYICNLFTESIGVYLNNFISSGLFTAPYVNGEFWPQNWDMYWWVDWMAYAPLLGLFMVRVGYGRTLREFIFVEWVLPALFGILWFSVFGGTILHAQLWQGIDFYAIYQAMGVEALTLAMFDVLPLSSIAKIVMLVTIAISLVTQCNSMAATLAGMCAKDSSAEKEAPAVLTLFWGVIFAVVAIVFTALGGIDGVKTIKSCAGIPMTFFCFVIMISFMRYLFKRPREANGDYVYEDEVKDAPDNNEPMAPRSKIKIFRKMGW